MGLMAIVFGLSFLVWFYAFYKSPLYTILFGLPVLMLIWNYAPQQIWAPIVASLLFACLAAGSYGYRTRASQDDTANNRPWWLWPMT
jgi:hypothetical protein